MSLSAAVTVEEGTLSSSILTQAQRWVDTSDCHCCSLAWHKHSFINKPIAGLPPSLPGDLVLLLSTADSAHVLHR